MERIGTLLVLGLILSLSTSAQYRVNKQKYNPKEYQWQAGDRLNPAIAGVASYFIPGLGQMISGKVGRGAAFFGGFVGCSVIFTYGAIEVIWGEGGGGIMIIGLLSTLGVQVWSIVDAVQVAKVKNMVLREAASRIKLQPYVSNLTYSNQLSAGLTFKVNLN